MGYTIQCSRYEVTIQYSPGMATMSNGAMTCQVPKNGVLSYPDSLNPGSIPGCHSNSDSPGTIRELSSHKA